MSNKEQDDDSAFFRKELDAIRAALGGKVGDAKLKSMQLRMDVLKAWRVLTVANDDHNHDGNDHHDHVHSALAEPLTDKPKTAR